MYICYLLLHAIICHLEVIYTNPIIYDVIDLIVYTLIYTNPICNLIKIDMTCIHNSSKCAFQNVFFLFI